MSTTTVQLAHELDAAWIMALYKAVHGGDPPPELVAAQVIAAVAPYLKGASNTMTFPQLEKQFKSLGADVTAKDMTQKETAVQPKGEVVVPVRIYCFTFKGETYCIKLPTLTPHLPQ
jgi:hypothetical protein